VKDYLVEIGWRLLGVAAIILLIALAFGSIWLFFYLISLNMIVSYIFLISVCLFVVGVIFYWLYIFVKEQTDNIKTAVRIKRRNRENGSRNETL